MDLPALRLRARLMDKLHLALSDWLFAAIVLIYFFMNAIAICVAGLALYWYVAAKQPVVDWIDPDGPGYRVLAVEPDAVTVQWIQLRLLRPCPGRTEVAILGAQRVSNIEAYPFLIDEERRTFVRRYKIPPDFPPGQYQLRIVDIARCSPLFESRQVLRVPFELPAR